VSTSSWSITTLNNQHDRSNFDCGDSALNNYLKTLASQHIKTNISRTFVATTLVNSAKILGFYTLSAGSIAFDSLPDKLPKYPIPIIRIGRLAVEKQLQGQGVGEYLLMDALHRCASHAKEIGIYGVVVDAKHQKAKNFYLKYGFVELTKSPLTLFVSIKDITATI
jgi:predicted GNAT family N-acyltransferase